VRALDTNVLVRFLVQDDENQAATVDQLFGSAEQQKETLFISLLVVLELIWVLQSAYSVKSKDIVLAISALLQMPILEFEKQAAVREFVGSAEGFPGDLAYLLIAHSSLASTCEHVLTFDKKAAGYLYFTLL
jgi:predicted nucleic-acid-binding protein